MPEHADQRRLYADLTWAWPIISPKENYVGEAEQFWALITHYARIPVRRVLHLGCGGGHIDYTLKQHAALTGVDVSEAMLGLARELNPDVVYVVGDMREVRLGRKFDAVVIADSIDYMLSLDELRAAFRTAYEHLEHGGALVTCAEVTRERFRQNESHCSSHSAGDVDIAFFENRYDPDPSDMTYGSTFVFLIRRAGEVSIETDQHLGGIFGIDDWRRVLRQAGFLPDQVELKGEPAPYFIGVKPPPA